MVTQVAAGSGALVWGIVELLRRQQMSVLGMATGAIAGLIAVTPASGFVSVFGGLCIGAAGSLCCVVAVTYFKSITGIDDALDVFALHGVGGLVGTVLTPVFALPQIAPVTATVWVNFVGSMAVMLYAGVASFLLLRVIQFIVSLRVTSKQEAVGLDLAQHGESAA